MKDTLNLLTHNQWSGTEYLSDITGFAVYNSSNVLRETSNIWSENGENSLKITKLKENSFWVRAYSQNEIHCKTITGEVTIRTTNSSVKVYLLEIQNGITIQGSTVTVPANTVANINLSLFSGDANTSVAIHVGIVGDVGDICYIDNLQLFSS